MKTLNIIKKILAVVLMVFVQFVFVPIPKAQAYSNPAAVSLLTVDNFAALAKSTITNDVAGTVLNDGDMGLDSPATCTGFPSPCTGVTTNGTINNGTIQYQNAVALQGQTDATAVVTDLNGRSADTTLLAQLGGQTLTQGVYDVPADTTNLTGDLTLSGDADSIFIFRMASTLITDTGSRVLLSGGVQSCNVFWTVGSSATFNGTTTFEGTVLAQASVDFPAGGATVNGRVLAQTAAITFRNTTVNNPSCAAAATTTATTTSTTTTSAAGPAEISCPPLPSTLVALSIIDSRRVSSTSIFLSWGPNSGVDSFNIQYGPSNANWLYNTNVTGFSTTINNLPANQPMWFQIAGRNDCAIGSYGPAKLVGGTASAPCPTTGNPLVPCLPNTGFSSQRNNIPWYTLVGGVFLFSFFLLKLKRT